MRDFKVSILLPVVENQIPEEVVQKLDPNRRKFILGILAAGITAPTVASFVMGKANKSTVAGSPIRPAPFVDLSANASIIDASGNFKFTIYDPSGNTPFESANFVYNSISGNFLRDSNGKFAVDGNGYLQCGTSGNVLTDASGNILLNYDFIGNPDASGNNNIIFPDPSFNNILTANANLNGNITYIGNPVWQLDPSGNWSYDGSGNIQLYWGATLDPSGNQFNDYFTYHDASGVYNPYASLQIPGVACVVSANHIRQVQGGPSLTTTVAPTTTSAPTTTVAPTTTSAPTTTTTVPVTPIVPSGSIPATR